MSTSTPVFSNTAELVSKLPGASQKYLPKCEMEDGQQYVGRCRNSQFAVWRAAKNCFEYTRLKFAYSFIEEIKHPEDFNGFDVFFPYAKA